MSWMKRPNGNPGSIPGPGQAPYNSSQPPSTDPHLMQNQHMSYPPSYQAGQPNHPPQTQPPPQQYWQPNVNQHPDYNQQFAQQQYQPQPNYNASNANTFYNQHNPNYPDQQQNIHPQYHQPFVNTQFNQNHPPTQPTRANYPTPNQQKENWDDADPWNWGWEDNSGAHQPPQPLQQQGAQQTTQVQQQHRQATNNANVLAESFGNTDTWNWSVDDKNAENKAAETMVNDTLVGNVDTRSAPTQQTREPEKVQLRETTDLENRNTQSPSIQLQSVPDENVRSLNDREVIKERIPNLALGKRFHSDNLTPQWSIESQMSQESSDGPLTHSESTYRSDNPSRNSSKSSPGLVTDNTNFNYAHSSVEDTSPENGGWNQGVEQPAFIPPIEYSDVAPEVVNQELANSVNGMHITVNRENITPDNLIPVLESQEVQASLPPPPIVASPGLNRSSSPATGPSLPPPTSFMGPAQGQNPFKRAGPLSQKMPHQSTPIRPPNSLTPESQVPRELTPKPALSTLMSPSVVNKAVQQHQRPASNYPTANLETTPDNSERPDQPQVLNYRPIQIPPHMSNPAVENLEVAPKNDRNEYLQTGNLTSSDYGDNRGFNHNIPPPGLRRMVVGQQESELALNTSMTSDEPPPGLSRMVPGQLTDNENIYAQSAEGYLERQIDGQLTDNESDNMRPHPFRQADGQQTENQPSYNTPPNTRNAERRPIGLDRMVPGESSSNEFRVQQFQNPNFASQGRPDLPEQRVVTGLDHDYVPISNEGSDVREQNVDGSDYTENVNLNPSRNIIGSTENADLNIDVVTYNEAPSQSTPAEPDVAREILMEGENLQDLSAINNSDYSILRNERLDGADLTPSEIAADRKTDLSDSTELPMSSSRQLLNRTNTSGDDSERDRAFKTSPRRDRDRHKLSKERERKHGEKEGKLDRDRDERKSGRDRDDKKSERDKDSRRGDRDRRDYRDDRDRFDDRRYRRSQRDRRYETEDTDYYSDRERDKRRYREGSYSTSSKPPRPEDKDRRYRDDRDRHRRYGTAERDRKYEFDNERDANTSRRGERDRDNLDNTLTSRRGDRDRNRDRKYDERDRRYRDIETDSSKYGSVRRDKKDRDRADRYSSPSRPNSRDPDPTEDELNETLVSTESRRGERQRRQRRDHRERQYDAYYDRYNAGYTDPYLLQQRTYQYYENLRRTNPRAYMEIYNNCIAGQPLPPPPTVPLVPNLDSSRSTFGYPEAYPTLAGYDQSAVGRAPGSVDDRGSVHSGRSSANGKDRLLADAAMRSDYFYGYRRLDMSLGYQHQRTVASSIKTDHSGSRDFNTDASLNLQLEDSTVKSERMTPFKFRTAHVKGSISSTHLVTISPSYPVDGQPAVVEILNLNAVLASDPMRCELTAYPGPLVKGVTHKKTILEYCLQRSRAAAERGGQPASAVLLWELLVLLLRQNGMVIGTDIAELLMKNKRDYEHSKLTQVNVRANQQQGSRRNSAMSSGTSRSDLPAEEAFSASNEHPTDSTAAHLRDDDTSQDVSTAAADASLASAPRRDSQRANRPRDTREDSDATLERYRECLLFGNGKEALEHAMANGLWGHALQLAAGLPDRRARAAVASRFLSSQAPADPLHTLYCLMAGRQPPAVTCVLDEKWGDWRPHLAMILSNASSRPELDKRAITQLGDTLSQRGDLYAAQFCYVMARLDFGRHPTQPLSEGTVSAPARLVLLGACHRRPFGQFATSDAIVMTEIYEYACSLSDPSFVLAEFQLYKYLLATRLTDCGLYERALAYLEQLALVFAAAPANYSHALMRSVLALAERLKYFDPEHETDGAVLDDDATLEAEQLEGSPQHDRQWMAALRNVVQDGTTASLAPTERRPSGLTTYSQQQPGQPLQQWGAYQEQQPHHNLAPNLSQDPSQDHTGVPPPTDHAGYEYQYQNHEENHANLVPTIYNPSEHQNTAFYAPNQNAVPYGEVQNGPYVVDQQNGAQEVGEMGQDDLGQDLGQYGGQTSESGYWNQENQLGYGYNEPTPDKETTATEQTVSRKLNHMSSLASTLAASRSNNTACRLTAKQHPLLLEPAMISRDNSASKIDSPTIIAENAMSKIPMARINPRTVSNQASTSNSSSNSTVHKLPVVMEMAESNIEVHSKSSSLRKRITASVHPKPDYINLGFVDNNVARNRTQNISRGSSLESDCSHGRPSPNERNKSLNKFRMSPVKKQLSDLDIHIAHSPQLGLSANSSLTPEMENTSPIQRPTSRKKYGSVISNTVDIWARQSVRSYESSKSLDRSENNQFKPLVFGGTFPIDEPASPPEARSTKIDSAPRTLPEKPGLPNNNLKNRDELRKTIERSLDRFEEMMSKRLVDKVDKRKAFSKRVITTFDIDEPMQYDDLKIFDQVLKEPDAKRDNIVSTPKTFNIDEPVSFI